MSLPAPRRLALPTVAVVGSAVVIMVALGIHRDRVGTVGQTVQFDDFFFTLQGARRSMPVVSSGDVRQAPLVDYVVTLTIENRAKRVNFRFGDEALELVDRNGVGRAYHVAADRQKAHEETRGARPGSPLVLKAGESVTKDYVFAVPADLTNPRLILMPGGRVGRFLESMLGGTTQFQLP